MTFSFGVARKHGTVFDNPVEKSTGLKFQVCSLVADAAAMQGRWMDLRHNFHRLIMVDLVFIFVMFGRVLALLSPQYQATFGHHPLGIECKDMLSTGV